MSTKNLKIAGILFLLSCFVLVFFLTSCATINDIKTLDEASDLLRQDRYNEAIDLCSDVIDRRPENAQAYITRGVAYDYLGDYDLAIADYTKAIEIDPSWTLALNNRGVAFIHKGDYEPAIVDFTRALEIDPDFRGALEELQRAQEMLNE